MEIQKELTDYFDPAGVSLNKNIIILLRTFKVAAT